MMNQDLREHAISVAVKLRMGENVDCQEYTVLIDELVSAGRLWRKTHQAIIMALLMTALESASEVLHLPLPFLQAVIPLPANFFFDMFEPVLQAFI